MAVGLAVGLGVAVGATNGATVGDGAGAGVTDGVAVTVGEGDGTTVGTAEAVGAGNAVSVGGGCSRSTPRAHQKNPGKRHAGPEDSNAIRQLYTHCSLMAELLYTSLTPVPLRVCYRRLAQRQAKRGVVVGVRSRRGFHGHFAAVAAGNRAGDVQT